MPWYDGRHAPLEHLETVPARRAIATSSDFRYPGAVRHPARPRLSRLRGADRVRRGARRRRGRWCCRRASASRVGAIDTFDGELDDAFAPMSVALRLADEIDVSRGDMLVHPTNLPRVARAVRGDGRVDDASARSIPSARTCSSTPRSVVRARIERIAERQRSRDARSRGRPTRSSSTTSARVARPLSQRRSSSIRTRRTARPARSS